MTLDNKYQCVYFLHFCVKLICDKKKHKKRNVGTTSSLKSIPIALRIVLLLAKICIRKSFLYFFNLHGKQASTKNILAKEKLQEKCSV